MAHELDITEGQTSLVLARTDAWHTLGTTLDHSFTAEEAMKEGHLGGWDVRKGASWTTDPKTGLTIPMPGRYSVLRDNPIVEGQVDVLGNVGEAYRIIQNEEHAELLNTLVDESGAHFDTAGAIEGGRRVFISMKLPGHINIGGVDQIDNYIVAVNGHDGGSSFTFLVTPVRPVCKNTLTFGFAQASNTFRVRHTSGASKILIQQARETLDMTFNYLDVFQEEANKMINTELTQSRFEEIIEAEWGAEEDAAPATITRTDAKLTEMARLFSDANTQKGVRNTAWAGLNAMTEWADHFSPTRGDDREVARARKSILDPSFKNVALALMMAEV
jgi:phage/plasmid-like protein (TIGR03299 family)